MIDELTETARELSDDPAMEVSFSSTHGTGGDSSVNVICQNETGPICVCRLSRWRDRRIRREWEHLNSLHASIDDPFVRETLEEPITLKQIDGRSVIFKQFMSGRNGKDFLSADRERVSALLSESLRWLAAFQTATRDAAVNDSESKRDALHRWGVPCDSAHRALFIDDDAFSVGPTHGDYNVRNVMISGDGRLQGVIDFEDYSSTGVRLYDLGELLISVAIQLYGLDASSITQHLFCAGGEFADLVEDTLSAYCDRAPLDLEKMPTVLPLYSEIKESNLRQRGRNGEVVQFHTALQRELQRAKDGS